MNHKEEIDNTGDETLDRLAAREAIMQMVIDDDEPPSYQAVRRHQDLCNDSRVLYGYRLIVEAALELLWEGVHQTRQAGVSWDEVGEMMAMPPDLAELVYAGVDEHE